MNEETTKDRHRVFMAMSRMEEGARVEVLFTRGQLDEHEARTQLVGAYRTKLAALGPVVEIDPRYVPAVEAVLCAALGLRRKEEGEGDPIFFYVVRNGHAYDARTLMDPTRVLGNRDDFIHMAGSVSDIEPPTPGEAMAALGEGLDRYLAATSWDQLIGEPKKLG